jgi:hypothetical protein
MGSDEFDCLEDWLHGRNTAEVGATGRAGSGATTYPLAIVGPGAAQSRLWWCARVDQKAETTL